MAGWGEMNLARFAGAQAALSKGQEARSMSNKLLHDRINQLEQLGVDIFNKERFNQLQRELPDIGAVAKVHEKEMGTMADAIALGLAQKPGAQKPADVLPAATKLPMTEEPAAAAPEPEKTETADGSMYPAQYAKKYGVELKELRFYDKAGNDVTEVVKQQANQFYGKDNAKAKVPPGTTVSVPEKGPTDYSKYPQQPTEYARFQEMMGAPGLRPDTDRAAKEDYKPPVLPEAVRLPEAPHPQSGAGIPETVQLPPSTPREQPNWRTGTGFDEAYGARVAEYATNLEVEKTKNTDVYKMRLEEVMKQYPDLKRGAQEAIAMERVHGFRPIDYRTGDAASKLDRERRGLLEVHLEEGMQKFITERPGVLSMTQDAAGGAHYGIAPQVVTALGNDMNKARDYALEELLDYEVKRSEQGYTDFSELTKDPEYKQMTAELRKHPKTSKEYQRAYDAWREVIKPFVEEKFDQWMQTSPEVAAKTSKGGGFFSALNTLEPVQWVINKQVGDRFGPQKAAEFGQLLAQKNKPIRLMLISGEFVNLANEFARRNSLAPPYKTQQSFESLVQSTMYSSSPVGAARGIVDIFTGSNSR